MTSSNPLSGLSGRAALLRRLGATLEESPAVFSQNGLSRPGFMLGMDYLGSHLIQITCSRTKAPRHTMVSQWSFFPRFGMSLPSISVASGPKVALNSPLKEGDWEMYGRRLHSTPSMTVFSHTYAAYGRSPISRAVPQTHSMALLFSPPSAQECQYHH